MTHWPVSAIGQIWRSTGAIIFSGSPYSSSRPFRFQLAGVDPVFCHKLKRLQVSVLWSAGHCLLDGVTSPGQPWRLIVSAFALVWRFSPPRSAGSPFCSFLQRLFRQSGCPCRGARFMAYADEHFMITKVTISTRPNVPSACRRSPLQVIKTISGCRRRWRTASRSGNGLDLAAWPSGISLLDAATSVMLSSLVCSALCACDGASICRLDKLEAKPAGEHEGARGS